MIINIWNISIEELEAFYTGMAEGRLDIYNPEAYNYGEPIRAHYDAGHALGLRLFTFEQRP